MKKDKIPFIKTNLISFTIVGLICVGIGVYAAVTFPSNEVSYDNKTSGLKSTTVKGAIDELYKECTQTPADKVIEDGQLEKDPYECRYFFTGANPNNYITFNGEKAGWRIISAECDGTIKIMRNENIGNMAWDSYSYNDWNNSSLNTYLNGTYLNNTLNSAAKSQIVTHSWNIGTVSYNNDLKSHITSENNTKWTGQVALLTVSEYLRTNSNSSCETFNSYNNNYSSCKNSTWMSYNSIWWTLTPYSSSSYLIFNVRNNGYITYSSVYTTDTGVKPVLYLSSNLKLSGSGTQSDPYTIK